MNDTAELMAQHFMKVEYAYSPSTDTLWVRASSGGRSCAVSESPQGLAFDTQSCVEQLAEALK